MIKFVQVPGTNKLLPARGRQSRGLTKPFNR